MTWFKVDDDLPMHEKMAALCEGPCRGDAIALWTFSGCWSSRALKEGFVSTGVVRSYGFHPDAAQELVRVGLWTAMEGGYQFHDWADYQPSAARVEERRRAGACRKAASRKRLSQASVSYDVPQSQRDCVPVTGVPRIESQGCLADASRDRDRDPSASSSDLTEEVKLSDTAPAREPAVVLDFRRPLPEPPGDLCEATGPSDAQLRRLAARSFSDAILAVFGGAPGRPSDEDLDYWIDQVDRTVGADQRELESLLRTAAYNWAVERKAWNEASGRGGVPRFSWMLDNSPQPYLAKPSGHNPRSFQLVYKPGFSDETAIAAAMAAGAAE